MQIYILLLVFYFGYSIQFSNAENSRYDEIRYLTGKPDYKSVNLTWEIENTTQNSSISNENLNSFPKLYQIYYCELQSFGPHRCKSKIIEDKFEFSDDETIKKFTTTIDNLRMATKYSFHIKQQIKRKLGKITGRMNFDENEIDQSDQAVTGETIIIPTKGFSALATKCLPEASEIEVETGPYFGGKIVVDGSDCGIKGNSKNSKDKYIMRIDHKKCGSLVRPETNTVETFITVQENLGIFTHSTRKFVVVCTFQSGMQTVRASFTVPGANGMNGVASVEENDPFIPDERIGRSRKFQYVDKTELILKDQSTEDTKNAIASIEISDQTKDKTRQNDKELFMNINTLKNGLNTNYERLIDENFPTDRRRNQSITNYSTGITIACSLSVIMIGVFLYVLNREFKRQKSTILRQKIEIQKNNSISK